VRFSFTEASFESCFPDVYAIVGGALGRRMVVHLPDGRKEMVVIPQSVKAGQMLEVDAPRPLHF
jgi:hypothetical protein